MKKDLNTDKNVRVVTTNHLIKGCGIEKMSLKSMKLLYIALSQCKVKDTEFYEYEISIPDFADLMGVDPSNVYREADNITDELMQAFVTVKPQTKQKFKKYPIFAYCEYDNNLLFQINKRMTDFLLGVTEDFTKPLLDDFLKMSSVYSIRVWHLLQKVMKSQKPVFAIQGNEYEYYLSMDELRDATGTRNKLKQSTHFRERVLDVAVKDIENCAGITLTYRPQKKGKNIVGYYFKVIPWASISQRKADEISIRKGWYEPDQGISAANDPDDEQLEGQTSMFDFLK